MIDSDKFYRVWSVSLLWLRLMSNSTNWFKLAIPEIIYFLANSSVKEFPLKNNKYNNYSLIKYILIILLH